MGGQSVTDPSIINITLAIFGLAFAVMGWFARELWSAVKELRTDLVALKQSINDNYVRKDDFKEFRHELLGFLQRIENKLDMKQDK
jgi:cell division protein FtsB